MMTASTTAIATPVLELSDLSKSYSKAAVVHGVNLSIADKEFVVFVGPSGSGKSTLLRMIAGLEEVTGGELLIDGKRVNDVPASDRGLAMVFQSYALYPHMTVRQNMAFSLENERRPRAEINERVGKAARILQIEKLLDRKPKQMSGGQRQRVAIGRAIVRQPEVFLFDEPLSNLDAALRVDMRMEIAKLHADLGATMIYVTHDQVEAMTLADKIVVLDGGVVQQVGSPIELYQRPANLFVAGFIGSPKMNFVDVSVDKIADGTITVSGADVVSVPVALPSGPVQPGDRLTLGVRPHDLVVAPSGAIVGRVIMVERLGNETIVNLELPSGASWLAVLDGDQALKRGESLALDVDPGKALLFDRDGRLVAA